MTDVIYIFIALLLVLNFVWLVLVFLGLPGNWMMVVSTGLLAWWKWDEGVFSIYTLGATVVLAGLGELLELLGGMRGSKKAGGSFRSSLGAMAAFWP